MLACHAGPGLTEGVPKPEHVSATELEDQLWLAAPLQVQQVLPSKQKSDGYNSSRQTVILVCEC